MKNFLQIINKHWLFASFSFFGLSRLFIFLNPPRYVRYFEEYANIWYYGMPPYLQHWFEYPPLTIPFISAPLHADLAGIGSYPLNFRIMMLIVDLIVFILILRIFHKMKTPKIESFFSILFYLALTTKAKDFMYENLDMLFTLSVLIPATIHFILPKVSDAVTWCMLWFGVGIKLVNAPLAAIYLLASKKPYVKRAIWPLVMFLIIWAFPLLYFRSSLLVIYVYHKDRTLQVESIPSLIVRGIDIFTKTEEIYLSNYKSYDMKGPISDVALPLANIALVASMLYMLWYAYNHRYQSENPYFLMKMTLIFIFSYLITNKVFSTPYHLWYMPLLILFPYKSWKERGFVYVATAMFSGIATTPLPSIEIGTTSISTLIPVLFQIPAAVYLFLSMYKLELPEAAIESKVTYRTIKTVKPEKKKIRK